LAKRILVYTNHFYPENFKVNDVAHLLMDNDNEVTVITGVPNYPSGNIFEGYGIFKRNRELYNGIQVIRLPLIPRGSGTKFRLVLNYLSYFISCLIYTFYIVLFKKKYDVVFVHHTSPVLIAFHPILIKFFRNSKLILWDLDMWPDTLVAMGIIKSKYLIKNLEALMKWLYKKYDYILVGSKSFEEIALKRIGNSNVSYFPNWAENTFTDNVHSKECEKLNFKFPEEFKIMYAGNIGDAQDFENIFKAMQLLKDKPINWLFVGDGRKRKWLEKQIEEHNMTHRVEFYGSFDVSYMPYFFKRADVMFFSLKNEEIFTKTVPAKLQSYMASRKAVVGMISGEGNSLIKSSNCGYSVESGDYKSFARVIEDLSKMVPSEIETFGENGFNYYQEHYSLNKRKAQLRLLMENI